MLINNKVAKTKAKPLISEWSVPLKKDVEYIRDALNSADDQVWLVELRRLAKSWQDSGRVTWAFFTEHEPRAAIALDQTFRVRLVPTKERGPCQLEFIAEGPGRESPIDGPYSAIDHARQVFFRLLINPQCDRLRGPCKRCGKYFISKTDRERIYCSPSCGAATTTIPATRKKREAAHSAQLAKAQEWINKWPAPKKNFESWQKWVAKKSGLTPKWLTRAVNKGQLQIPAMVNRLT